MTSNQHASPSSLLLLFLLVSQMVSCANASSNPVNVNIKSKKLSSILQPQTDSSQSMESTNIHSSSPSSTTANPTSDNGGSNHAPPSKSNTTPSLVTLDLAGEVKTHISSPSYIAPNGMELGLGRNDDEDPCRTTPLFHWGRVHIGPNGRPEGGQRRSIIPIPTVHAGAIYDFKRTWYGATRIVTSLSWGNVPKPNGGGQRQKRPAVLSKVRGEMGLTNPNDYSVEMGLQFPQNRAIFQRKQVEQTQEDDERGETEDGNVRLNVSVPVPNAKLSVRYDTKDREQSATVAASASIHPRLGIAARGILLLPDAVGSGLGLRGLGPLKRQEGGGLESHFLDRIPQEKVRWSEGSWLPDVKMTAGGKIVTKSAIGLSGWRLDGRKIIHNDMANRNGLGVRLMVSRQINWNIVGMFQGSDDGDYDNDTTLRLEVGGLGTDSYTSISAEAALERIPETFRCTLLQERVLKFSQ